MMRPDNVYAAFVFRLAVCGFFFLGWMGIGGAPYLHASDPLLCPCDYDPARGYYLLDGYRSSVACDSDRDGRTGLAEAIHILQVVAGLRSENPCGSVPDYMGRVHKYHVGSITSSISDYGIAIGYGDAVASVRITGGPDCPGIDGNDWGTWKRPEIGDTYTYFISKIDHSI